MDTCNYGKAWIGKCKNPATEDDGRCKEHSHIKCVSCGEPATHQCEETGQFVCGADLCDNCEHTLHTDGSNGGIGFFMTAPLPEGMREHCKKGEQKVKSWAEQEWDKLSPEEKAAAEQRVKDFNDHSEMV